jgi:uncharacterized protein
MNSRNRMDTQQRVGELEIISETECLDLLTRHSLGRLAVVVSGRPLIFPVNYAWGDRVIAIRTVEGTKLAAARNSHVAFEIDSYDPDAGIGWSVLVQGVAYEITEAVDRQSRLARRLPVRPLPSGPRDHWLAIHPVAITGRRFWTAN